MNWQVWYPRTWFLVIVMGLVGRAVSGAEEDSMGMETIIVTATRTQSTVAAVPSSVTVIDRQTITNRQCRTVAEALRGVAGISVFRSGGTGSTTTARLRGCESRHVLVLIDGVRAADTSGVDRAFDWADLGVSNVERIEVLRGTQSTLYGSEAIGGVINIITRAAPDGFSGETFAEVGSEDNTLYRARIALGKGALRLTASAERTGTDGISAVDENIEGVTEPDGHERNECSLRASHTPAGTLRFDLTGRYSDSKTDLDGWQEDDVNSSQYHEQFTGRFLIRHEAFAGRLQQRVGVSYTYHDRWLKNAEDEAHRLNDWSAWEVRVDSGYEGETLSFDYQGNLPLGDHHLLTWGAETIEETMRGHYELENAISLAGWSPIMDEIPKVQNRTNGYYLQDQITALDERFNAVLGLRWDDHETFGSKWTWRAGASYRIARTGTRVRANVGTGFNAPSLYQLYMPLHPAWGGGGNAALQPEEAFSWDLGIEQPFFAKNLLVDVTCFSSRVSDLIDWVPDFASPKQGGYVNVSKSRSRGVEVGLRWHCTDRVVFSSTYTYTDAKSLEPNQELSRRPHNQATAAVEAHLLQDRLTLNLGARYTGSRQDGAVRMEHYTVADFGAAFDVHEQLRLHARVENLFDREYQAISGFGTAGRTFHAGLTFTF